MTGRNQQIPWQWGIVDLFLISPTIIFNVTVDVCYGRSLWLNYLTVLHTNLVSDITLTTVSASHINRKWKVNLITFRRVHKTLTGTRDWYSSQSSMMLMLSKTEAWLEVMGEFWPIGTRHRGAIYQCWVATQAIKPLKLGSTPLRNKVQKIYTRRCVCCSYVS